jgi:uncharacterized GH25 family protein
MARKFTIMTRPTLIAGVTLLLTALTTAATALAHEFWIEPSHHVGSCNEPIRIDLKVGHGPDLTVLPRNPERYERFVVAGPSGERDVLGVDGAAPAGIVRPADVGTYLVGYRSRSSSVELPPAKFEAYLKEEGLESTLLRRIEQGRSAAPGRERFSRCAKSIVVIGDAPHVGFDRSLDFRLELFPERDPRELVPGESATFRLLFDGAPLANVLVRATAMDQFEHQRSARTDAQGRVTLPIAHPGRWRLNAVHMLELAPDAGRSADTADFVADYESLWASLTFEVPDARPSSPPAPVTTGVTAGVVAAPATGR